MRQLLTPHRMLLLHLLLLLLLRWLPLLRLLLMCLVLGDGIRLLLIPLVVVALRLLYVDWLLVGWMRWWLNYRRSVTRDLRLLLGFRCCGPGLGFIRLLLGCGLTPFLSTLYDPITGVRCCSLQAGQVSGIPQLHLCGQAAAHRFGVRLDTAIGQRCTLDDALRHSGHRAGAAKPTTMVCQHAGIAVGVCALGRWGLCGSAVDD